MKLAEATANVLMSEGINAKSYRIKVNRKSFKLLYGDLYAYKIRAIIRELSTNAFDSHVAAGKAHIPFEVHLPNELEPYFSVRDFGTGMSPEKVDEVYTILFESDKTDSDDYTGCLGLGSKSPFNYTESFSLESVVEGKKYVYANFLNKEGNPSFAEIGRMDTTEGNGVEVKFPIQLKDIDQFIGEAAEVYKWFKVRPTIVGAIVKYDEEEYLTKGDNYAVAKENRGISHVIMGNVCYPVDVTDLSYSHLDDVEREVLRWGVDLFVKIGSAEFVPSREHLSYSDKTIDTIKKYLKNAISSIRVELDKEINGQTSVWQARCLLHKIKHSILGKVRPSSKVSYKGEEIDDYITINKLYDETAASPTFSLIRKKYNRKNKEKFVSDTVETISCGDFLDHSNTKIYVNDLEKGAEKRIIYNLQHNNSGGKAFLLSGPGVTDKFLEVTGLKEIISKASELPKPTYKVREKNPDGTVRSYVKRSVLQEFNPIGGSYYANYWKDVEVDLSEGGIYVITSYGQVVYENGAKLPPNEISKKFHALNTLKPGVKIYGIRPVHLERMKRHSAKWYKWEDYVAKVIKENESLKHSLHLLRQLDDIETEDLETFAIDSFTENSLFRQYLENIAEAKKAEGNPKVIAYGELLSDIEDKKVLADLQDQVKKIYPLLHHLNWYGTSAFTEAVTEYIQAIDNMQEAVKEAV